MSASDNLSGEQFETFYHRTDTASAEKIIKSGRLKPSAAEDHVFVSDVLHGRARVFGSAVVEVRVHKKANRTDYSDNEGVGENWFAIHPRDAHVVSAYSEVGKK